MDALILSCSMGGGHDAAGHAVMEELKYRGHHAVMMNPYNLKSETLAERINNAYIDIAQKVPRAFGAIYKAGTALQKTSVSLSCIFCKCFYGSCDARLSCRTSF